MVVEKIICDRCGAEETRGSENQERWITISAEKPIGHPTRTDKMCRGPMQGFDLCPVCHASFRHWLLTLQAKSA